MHYYSKKTGTFANSDSLLIESNVLIELVNIFLVAAYSQASGWVCFFCFCFVCFFTLSPSPLIELPKDQLPTA
jgi:hypothetical protein